MSDNIYLPIPYRVRQFYFDIFVFVLLYSSILGVCTAHSPAESAMAGYAVPNASATTVQPTEQPEHLKFAFLKC